jgi:hypothetical protein
MYKFTANLKLDHISPGHRVASYFCNFVNGGRHRSWSCDGAVLLVGCGNRYFVVSFDKYLFCNNASELPYEKAWDFFDEVRRSFRETAEIVNDDETMRALAVGQQQLDEGQTVSWDDLKAELGMNKDV